MAKVHLSLHSDSEFVADVWRQDGRTFRSVKVDGVTVMGEPEDFRRFALALREAADREIPAETTTQILERAG